MSYLATHPRRALRVGDEVIYVGESASYRGKLGRVLAVYGRKSSGQVKILWDNRPYPMEYSIAWCIQMLGVHVNCLRVNYPDFHGRTYVDKYMHWAFQKGDVLNGYFLTPHHTMKATEDKKLAVEQKFNASNISIMQQLRASLEHCMPANLEPGIYTLVPSPAEPPKQKPQKEMTFPAIVENRADGTITRVSSEAMLRSLGEGTYTVYSKVGNISVKSVAQKEITFL